MSENNLTNDENDTSENGNPSIEYVFETIKVKLFDVIQKLEKKIFELKHCSQGNTGTVIKEIKEMLSRKKKTEEEKLANIKEKEKKLADLKVILEKIKLRQDLTDEELNLALHECKRSWFQKLKSKESKLVIYVAHIDPEKVRKFGKNLLALAINIALKTLLFTIGLGSTRLLVPVEENAHMPEQITLFDTITFELDKDERDIEFDVEGAGSEGADSEGAGSEDCSSIQLVENQKDGQKVMNISKNDPFVENTKMVYDVLPSKYQCAGYTNQNTRCKNKRLNKKEFPVWCYHHQDKPKMEFETFCNSDSKEEKEHEKWPWWGELKREKLRNDAIDIEWYLDDDTAGSLELLDNQKVGTTQENIPESEAENIKKILSVLPRKCQCAGKTAHGTQCRNSRLTKNMTEIPYWCRHHQDKKLEFEEFCKNISGTRNDYPWWSEIREEKNASTQQLKETASA